MKKFLLTLVAILVSVASFADIPAPTNKLVNDYASVMTASQAQALETSLRAYNDSTSTQICIVTVNSLDGYTPADYAQRLGEKWGVGQKGKDNGIVILIKKKTATSGGDVFIATGYGVEGALPDARCKRIIERTMIPKLKNGDYHGAIVAGVSDIQKCLSGEFKADKSDDVEDLEWWQIVLIVIIILVLLIAIAATSDGPSSGGSTSCHSSSSWGGGYSGGSSSRRSSGGSSFSFGGGHFGGGGAGGHF